MQSLGNDFILIDGIARAIKLNANSARRLADRHFGVGCDQILLVENAAAENNFRLRVFNHDGGEVGQCGNGARCVAKFLYDAGYAKNKRMQLRTSGANMTLTINADETVSVDMGAPEFRHSQIPFKFDGGGENDPGEMHSLNVNGECIKIGAVSLGNPHAVQLAADTAAAKVSQHGEILNRHKSFPDGVNAGFMQVITRDHIRLRVYERGAGETLGCGSGACAAVALGVEWGMLDSCTQVKVSLPGGDATVYWKGRGNPIILTGPAHDVFCGEIDL